MGVSGVQNGGSAIGSQHRCHCVDDLLAPIRSKMKVLKKIKKRMRLTPRNGSGGTNNLPPLLFHQVHGDNIRISGDGSIARRVESFCRGVTFSSRPVKIQEKVYVRFLEVSNNWSGVIRFGFTSNDPGNLRYSLPKYACPDLTNKPGYWAKALAERFAEKDTVLFYYVTQAGDVHFGINGEEKGIFFTGVETRGSLWALFDVYGNSTGIELVDGRAPLNNARRSGSGEARDADPISRVIPSLQSLFIQNPRSEVEERVECGLTSRYLQAGIEMSPLPLHRTKGQNVHLSNDRCVATRLETEFCLGYAFTSRPVRLGEEIVIQVLASESAYAGALAFGLTSCDPASLESSDLPEDADSLLDRPEYWVVRKDVAGIPQRGDEISFTVLPTGEVRMSKNRGPPIVFMHVDHTLRLWAFFDVYGTTQKIRVVGTVPRLQCGASPPPVPVPRPERLRVNLPRDRVSQSTPHATQVSNAPIQRYCCASGSGGSTQQQAAVSPASPELVQLQSTMGGGTVLVVNIPPAHSNYLNHQQQQQQQQQSLRHTPSRVARCPGPRNSSGASDRAAVPSETEDAYVEPVSPNSYADYGGDSVSAPTGSECSICYERPIDSVLYTCGHMCMCYECAVQQWRGKGGGHCPLCRAVIRDVILTYKS